MSEIERVNYTNVVACRLMMESLKAVKINIDMDADTIAFLEDEKKTIEACLGDIIFSCERELKNSGIKL